MTRARKFTKAEMMDAARAAAENGLCVVLHPSGEISFTNEKAEPVAGSALEGWLNGRKAKGLA